MSFRQKSKVIMSHCISIEPLKIRDGSRKGYMELTGWGINNIWRNMEGEVDLIQIYVDGTEELRYERIWDIIRLNFRSLKIVFEHLNIPTVMYWKTEWWLSAKYIYVQERIMEAMKADCMNDMSAGQISEDECGRRIDDIDEDGFTEDIVEDVVELIKNEEDWKEEFDSDMEYLIPDKEDTRKVAAKKNKRGNSPRTKPKWDGPMTRQEHIRQRAMEQQRMERAGARVKQEDTDEEKQLKKKSKR